MKEIKCKCPFCDKETIVEVTNVEYEELQSLDDVEMVLHKHPAMHVEAVKSGICYDCQEMIFHRPATGNTRRWGKKVGMCDICNTPLYANMDKYGDAYRCSNCMSILHLGDSGELSCTLEDYEEVED